MTIRAGELRGTIAVAVMGAAIYGKGGENGATRFTIYASEYQLRRALCSRSARALLGGKTRARLVLDRDDSKGMAGRPRQAPQRAQISRLTLWRSSLTIKATKKQGDVTLLIVSQ